MLKPPLSFNPLMEKAKMGIIKPIKESCLELTSFETFISAVVKAN